MTFDTYRPRGSYTRHAPRYQGKQRSFQFSLRDLTPHIETILKMDLAEREATRWSAIISEEERKAIVAMHNCIKGKLQDLRRQGKI